jgi:glucosamine--fructose-6-phosphate aminotransferase (isomerizing)
VKDAFRHYLPDVEFEAVESIELSRHYDFPDDCSDTIALFISFSGGVYRTIEALNQCKRHGITTIAVTDNLESKTAEDADIVFHTDDPKGDNHAGLRTYYSNVISCIILAAAMAEQRTGKELLPALRKELSAYHDEFFGCFEDIDQACFLEAVRWLDKKSLEIVGDGNMFWAGKFIQAKVIELSGDACTVVDSEDYMHVNRLMGPGKDIGEIVLIDGSRSTDNLVRDVNWMTEEGGRSVFVMSDRTPEELGIKGKADYCRLPLPGKEWDFLSSVYAYLPGALFAGFRHTTLGEPMFRGGFDPSIFIPTYFSPIDVIDR